MTNHAQRRRCFHGGLLAIALLALACGDRSVRHDGSGGASGGGGGGGGGGMAGAIAGACDEAPAPPRRLVRLSLTQIAGAVGDLLGGDAARLVSTTFNLPAPDRRAFPPLDTPNEGRVIGDGLWPTLDGIAQTAAQYVLDHFAALTGCPTDAAGDACARQFLAGFAQKAYRRPVEAAELDDLFATYAEIQATGASLPESVQYAVYAVLSDPQFLYRTELGDPAAATSPAPVAITPLERASALAFFLSDAPPDRELLDAAQGGRLTTADDVAAQVDRLLGGAAARANFDGAMSSYFGLAELDFVVIDDARVPEWNEGLRDAMERDSADFIHQSLWGGQLGDLLTSRHALVNPALAQLYGIAWPGGAGGAATDFISVELPGTRAGILTRPGFLVAHARTDRTSVVARGLLVNAVAVCADLPPEDSTTQDPLKPLPPDASDREEADARRDDARCGSCHSQFDPYGLALDGYDLIGRVRTVDSAGRPIDTAVTLPAPAGGGSVNDATQLSKQLAGNGVFTDCIARRLMTFALSVGGGTTVDPRDCALRDAVARARQSGDASFSRLVREIAVSPRLALRSVASP